MNKITITDFSGGILESNNTADFSQGNWGKLKGFVPRNSYTMESQWPIQSIGTNGEAWTGNDEHIKSVYPIQSVMGVFLIALKEDGSLWWAKAPEINDNYETANAVEWTELLLCENVGWDYNDNENQPGNILITANPDYRFITQLPFEVFKYIKKPDTTGDYQSFNITSVSIASVVVDSVTKYIATANIDVSSINSEIISGDEVYIEIKNGSGTRISTLSGKFTLYDATDNSIKFETSYSTIGSVTITAGTGIPGSSGSYVKSPALRGNKMDYDTLLTEGEYAKGIVSGVLISSRRRYLSDTDDFTFMDGITNTNHQTLVAYVDPFAKEVKVVSFPNIRRWPSFKVEDEIITEYTITGNDTTRYLNLTTQDYHSIKNNSKVKIKGLSKDIDGTYVVSSVTPSTGLTTQFAVKLKKPKKFKNTSLKVVKGTAEVLGSSYQPITPYVATNKKSSGEEKTFISRFPRQYNATEPTYSAINKWTDMGYIYLELSTTPTEIKVGTTVTISGVDSTFNGTYVVYSVGGNVISCRRELTKYQGTVSTTPISPAGTVKVVNTTGYPTSDNYGHPYTWLDENYGLHPGTGFIPRGNVGTMWGGHLIIGDIEYRKDIASTAHTSKKIKPNPNNALLGTEYNDDILRDSNTSASRGSFYYSDSQIDEFNPISVLTAAGTDTRIIGMHQLSNRLVVITTSGGQNDGVIVFSGLLSQLHPYNPGTPANPQAIRRQVIKGGVGPADFKDDEHWDVTPTCLWPDANMVCFIDSRGGIYGTDSSTVQRLDNFGPRIPRGSSPQDWVAAAGKNLLVWNQKEYAAEKGAGSARLLCFTLMTAANGQATGAWTELIGPAEVDENDNYLIYNLKSMYGVGTDFYGVATFYENVGGLQGEIVKSKVIRFAIGGPDNEKGTSDGHKLLLSVATPPLGDSDSFRKIGWNKVGVSFFTKAGAGLVGAIVKGASALEEQIPVINEIGNTVNNFPQWNNISEVGGVLDPRTFDKGLHNVIFPAGIGSTPVISVEWILTGDVRLESASVWYTGNAFQFGEDVASEE